MCNNKGYTGITMRNQRYGKQQG